MAIETPPDADLGQAAFGACQVRNAKKTFRSKSIEERELVPGEALPTDDEPFELLLAVSKGETVGPAQK